MSTIFRSIVQQVTEEKLEELKLQKEISADHFNPILKQIADPSITPTDALQILYKAINDCPLKEIVDSEFLQNLKYFLRNANDDLSITSQLVLAWVGKVKAQIEFALRRREYSYLYGSLLSEWLDKEEKKDSKGATATPQDLKNSTDEAVLNKKESTDYFKYLMFNQLETGFDAQKFQRFLSNELFNFADNVEGQNLIAGIQKESQSFFQTDDATISTYDVQCCITGLRSSELLSLEKKTALKELNENAEALNEVASLLSNRLKNINRWNWPSSDLVVELRRGLGREYKPFLDEDILTALFLQYVGVKWAAYFKRQFLSIYQSNVWTKAFAFGQSIEGERRVFHESTFLSALPDSMASQENKIQEEYVKVEASRQSSIQMFSSSSAPGTPASYSKAQEIVARPSYAAYPTGSSYPPGGVHYNAGSSHPGGLRLPPMPTYEQTQIWKQRKQQPKIDFKQAFLHTLSTEIRLNQVIRPEKTFTVVQADLDTFGPSIVHDCVLTALEYLGVPAQWIAFFKKFLQPNIRFEEGEEPKQVVRGVPTAHVLSSLFGETLLFLLEFLINKRCNGMRIYRIADEFWFWGTDDTQVAEAWSILNQYGKAVGLKIKENRSGSASVYSNEMLSKMATPIQDVSGPSPLPQKNIHWGYLQLNSSGTFVIDKSAVTKFATEMKELLDKSECVLEWINIFNKYLEFFVRNFGKSAVVTGKEHLNQITESLRIIYVGLFGSETGNPVQKLKARFDKLNSANIVDVWVYWPLERGGLGLVNPFIGILSQREAYIDIDDEDNFKKLPLEDKALWDEMKKEHERRYNNNNIGSNQWGPGSSSIYPDARQSLPTWAEYTAKRETELTHWYNRYQRMLDRPSPKSPPVPNSFNDLDAPIPEGEYEKIYLMWLLSYYETQLYQHFGSVKFVNSKLLPMSMIATIQKTKVQF